MPPSHLKSVWITGAEGLIGSALISQRGDSAAGVRAITRRDFDLRDSHALAAHLRQAPPSAVIHCAAISRSVECERDPELARRVNVEATRHLVDLANGVPFIFLSTDLVFDGREGNYVETAAPNPLSFYAETKVAAEEIVRRHPQHWIVRLSLTGGRSRTGDRGFNEEMKNAWRQGKTLNLFVDEYRCPCAAPVIARAIWELLDKRATGTFHLCGAEKLSRAEIGRLLAARHPELNPRMVAGSRKDYQGPPRPADTSMNCGKVQKLLSFELPRFSKWLAQDQTGF